MDKIFLFLCLLTLSNLSMSSTAPEEKPSNLKTITIDPKVQMSEKPDFRDGGEGVTWLLKKAGANLNDPSETLKKLMDAQNIDLPQMLTTAIKKQIDESNSPIQVVDQDGEAELHLTIESYGLKRVVLEGRMIPTIDLHASLETKQGEVIWENDENVAPKDEFREGTICHTWGDYNQSPELLKNDFAATIDTVAKRQIKTLNEAHKKGEITF